MDTHSDEATLQQLWQNYLDGPAPLHRNMGLRLVESSSSRAVVAMPYSDDFRGWAEKSIHGGILAALADVACAFTIATTYDWQTEVSVTTDLHIRYLGQPRSWPIKASANVVHRGRRLTSLECAIADAAERQLARATATYMMVPRI